MPSRCPAALHEADRAGLGLHVRIEAALCVDHSREQCRIEIVVLRVCADDVLVLEWVARSQVPVGLGVDHPGRGSRERE